MAEMGRCIGSAKYGIEAHEAPSGEFPAQPSQKDGLGRMCKPHWNQYTSALRKAALARKAAEGEAATEEAPKPKAAKPARSAPKASAPKPESPKIRKARELVAATESLGGEAYTDAVGSEEVQAALGVIAGGGQDDTFESDVRAILAEA